MKDKEKMVCKPLASSLVFLTPPAMSMREERQQLMRSLIEDAKLTNEWIDLRIKSSLALLFEVTFGSKENVYRVVF